MVFLLLDTLLLKNLCHIGFLSARCLFGLPFRLNHVKKAYVAHCHEHFEKGCSPSGSFERRRQNWDQDAQDFGCRGQFGWTQFVGSQKNWSMTTYRGLLGRLSLCTNMMLLVGVLHFVKSCWWYEIRREHENQKWDIDCEVAWLPYHGFYWSHLDSMVSLIYQSLLRGLGCAIKAGLILSLRSSQSLFSTPKSKRHFRYLPDQTYQWDSEDWHQWRVLWWSMTTFVEQTRYPVKVDCIPHPNSIS